MREIERTGSYPVEGLGVAELEGIIGRHFAAVPGMSWNAKEAHGEAAIPCRGELEGVTAHLELSIVPAASGCSLEMKTRYEVPLALDSSRTDELINKDAATFGSMMRMTISAARLSQTLSSFADRHPAPAHRRPTSLRRKIARLSSRVRGASGSGLGL